MDGTRPVVKSIRTTPAVHAAEGDERIRTAVPAPSTDPAYESRWELSILVGPCEQESAEKFLLAIQHKFRDHLGAAYALTLARAGSPDAESTEG